MSDIKMLSIDADGVITELDRTGYKKMGVIIKPASNFQAAEKILQDMEIDVIVINYDLEGIDAAMLCNHFKQSDETSDIPIVITSVQNVARQLKKSIKHGLDLFIEQPIPKQYFIEKLKTLLDQKSRSNNRIIINSKVSFENDEKKIECDISDISKTGILIATDLNLTIGKVFELTFPLPNNKKPIVVTGTVVREISENKNGQGNKAGFGIRFDKFGGDSQIRLDQF